MGWAAQASIEHGCSTQDDLAPGPYMWPKSKSSPETVILIIVNENQRKKSPLPNWNYSYMRKLMKQHRKLMRHFPGTTWDCPRSTPHQNRGGFCGRIILCRRSKRSMISARRSVWQQGHRHTGSCSMTRSRNSVHARARSPWLTWRRQPVCADAILH